MVSTVGKWLRGRRRAVILVAILLVLATGVACYFRWERRKADRLLREGEKALEAREYDHARDLLERYLVGRPADTHARLLAARAARQTKSFRTAREQLRRCRADGGDAESISVEDSLLDVLEGDERPVAELRERVKRDDDLALIILEVLIQHDLDTYQLGSALDEFTRYLAHRPNDLNALLGRAFVWERFLNFADALEDYRKAVSTHPDNDHARLKLAETLLIVGTPQEALAHFRWLAERWPERPPVRLGLARCYRRLAQPEEAAKLLEGLLAEFPNNGEVLWERGDLELDQGRPASAEPWLRKAATRLPFDRRVQYAMSRCLLELDRKTEAEVFATRVKRLDADLARLTELRGKVMDHPDDANLRCEGGLIFLRNGQREEGLRWLQLALRIDPRCEAARSALMAPGSQARKGDPEGSK